MKKSRKDKATVNTSGTSTPEKQPNESTKKHLARISRELGIIAHFDDLARGLLRRAG
jgi:hypothetical protein